MNQDQLYNRESFKQLLENMYDEVIMYENLPKSLWNTVIVEDILSVWYVSTPIQTFSFIGTIGKEKVHWYKEEEEYVSGIHFKIDFLDVVTFLIEQSTLESWPENITHPEFMTIDGHRYEIMIVLKNQKKVYIQGDNYYHKDFNKLLKLMGLRSITEEIYVSMYDDVQ